MQYIFSAKSKPEALQFLSTLKNPPLKLILPDIEGQKRRNGAAALRGDSSGNQSLLPRKRVADIATFRNSDN